MPWPRSPRRSASSCPSGWQKPIRLLCRSRRLAPGIHGLHCLLAQFLAEDLAHGALRKGVQELHDLRDLVGRQGLPRGLVPAKAGRLLRPSQRPVAIAKALGVPDAKVKKAIKDLGLQPKAKKGVCNYYSRDALNKLKSAVAK